MSAELVKLRRQIFEVAIGDRSAVGAEMTDAERQAAYGLAGEQAAEILALPLSERAARLEPIERARKEWVAEVRRREEAARQDAERAKQEHALALAALLQHSRECWRPTPVRDPLGYRATGEFVEKLRCPGCPAHIRLVDDEYEPDLGVETPAAVAAREADEPPAEAGPDITPRGPGRPGWDRATFHARYLEAWTATEAPRTPGRVAANFRLLDGASGPTPDYLARQLRRFGRPATE